jgi:hypothetical protein
MRDAAGSHTQQIEARVDFGGRENGSQKREEDQD